MLGLVQLSQPWKKYSGCEQCETTKRMYETYLRLEGLEGGRRGPLLGRGEGGGRADKGEGGELEHGWIGWVVSIEKIVRDCRIFLWWATSTDQAPSLAMWNLSIKNGVNRELNNLYVGISTLLRFARNFPMIFWESTQVFNMAFWRARNARKRAAGRNFDVPIFQIARFNRCERYPR